jgi:predicted Zn-dependent protease
VAASEKARKLDPKNGAFAADLCRALLEQKDAARAVGECKAAVDLDPKNPLGHYELTKALVAKGDCPGAKASLAKFKALPGVKPEAKAQADAIAASCHK